ncbi:transmembrane protein [Wufeng Eothenomys melanogaster jeilongvirus 1]|uniref:Transmembrane protein n=1 Tax=Wufeng Eothenomys melanogaster jeilongvirus 1 TaxID=2928990 RepID=A0A8T9KM26_9MONO|nr:transmembrane protein [Wufeng Eothenomys melanogaster jeilongvirus 1]WPV62630.1 MAG: transmembrane protein [Wufeng rodent jeilongvirus 2]
MNTDYATPAQSCSDYETMSAVTPVYKAVQLRRTREYHGRRNYIRHVRRAPVASVPVVYLAIITVLIAFNFSATCYLIVTTETSSWQKNGNGKCDTEKLALESCDQFNTISSTLNTLLHSMSYTIPQYLSTVKRDMSSELMKLDRTLKDILHLNQLTLDVKLGNNKSVIFRTGDYNERFRSKNGLKQPTTALLPTTYLTPTKVPASGTLIPPFYPLRSLDQSNRYLNMVPSRSHKYQATVYEEGERDNDYANMSPVM